MDIEPSELHILVNEHPRIKIALGSWFSILRCQKMHRLLRQGKDKELCNVIIFTCLSKSNCFLALFFFSSFIKRILKNLILSARDIILELQCGTQVFLSGKSTASYTM